MKVNLSCHNPALISIFKHREQTITMDAYFSLGLILKEKTSANLFDGLFMCVGRRSDLDKFRVTSFN